MAVYRIIEDTHEVNLTKKSIKKIRKRSGIPPNPAEANVADSLYTSKSYDNFGNHQPYGENGVASNQTNSGNGSVGSPPGVSGSAQ